MNRKEQILRMIEGLPDDVTYDRVLYHLDVMKHIEQGREDMEKGRVIDHDELFERILKEDAKNQNRVDRASRARSDRNQTAHRKGRPSEDSRQVRKTSQERRSKA
jgi:hypothetical protein